VQLSNTDGAPPIQVLHGGDGWVAVNKLPGMPVQADLTGAPHLLRLVRDQQGIAGLELVNRLDRPVSGAVVLAHGRALTGLNEAFRERTVRKVYQALVEGVVEGPPEVRLVHRLVQDARSHKARPADPDQGGRQAVLMVKVVRVFDRYTLLHLEPREGHFHQLRAQLSIWGHPIRGDVKYGARRGERDRSIALHAWQLYLPFGSAVIRVEAPVPATPAWRIAGS
jgi:23S rRNA pseudouridine1911/1915/1917 synthase